MPILLAQCSPLFLSNQTQLYKPNSTEIAGVNLPADAQAHPATGALRARVQSMTPKTATQTLAIITPSDTVHHRWRPYCFGSDSLFTLKFLLSFPVRKGDIYNTDMHKAFFLKTKIPYE